MAPTRGANPFSKTGLGMAHAPGNSHLSQSESVMSPSQQTWAQQPQTTSGTQPQSQTRFDTSTRTVQNQARQPPDQQQYPPLTGYTEDPPQHFGPAQKTYEEEAKEIDEWNRKLGMPIPNQRSYNTSGNDNNQVAHMQSRTMPNAAALPTAAAPEMPFFDSNNPARESYNQALPNVQNGTRPNSAAQSNGAIKPAINQAHGNSYSQPFPGSSVENGSQPTSAAWSNGAINPPIYQAQDNTVSYSQPSQGSVLDSGAQPTPAANGTGVINPATYQGRGSNVNYPQPSPRPVVENGAPPTPATYSNGVNNPAILQPQGSNVSYRRPTQESVQNTHSSNGTRAEAQPYKPAPGAPDGRQVPRTALSNVNVNVNTSVPSVIPMQQPYFHAPSAQWITDGGQHLIRLSFEDAKQLYQHVLSDWHLWPVALRDHDIPPLFAYVSRGSQNVQYTIVSNSLLGQLLTPQTSGTNMFGQQQSGAQQPPKGPKKNAPKKGGRGRPKKQANIEEDQTHVDMMDYHGTGKTRQFPATGTHSQYVQAPAGQPGSTQVPGFQRGPQASSNGTLREAGSTGAAPAAYPLNANGKSQEFNGQAHGLQQPSAVGAQGINGAHRGTQFNPLPNGPVASHQSQQNVENVAISAHPLSGNDRKRPREMYETEPNIAREAKRPRTTPAVSNINHRGKPEIPQQKQEATRGPNRVQNYEENQPTVQVCIGNLDPKAVGVALNMALDALRTGQALLKARPGDDALCVPPESHIVCLPPDGSIAYYGPSNTIAAGRRWQELSATSYRAGWLAASQHHSLAMAGVPIQDIKVEVFDSRKHQLTAVLADPSPKPHPLENAAPISVHAPLDSSRGRQGPEMQAKSDKDHTGDAATNRSSLPIEFQQDNALPSTAIPASYPEKHAWSDFIPNNEQAFTRSPSVGFVEPHGLAATGTEIADAGATWSILDRIWNDPTIPSVEDLNTAGDYGEPVIPAPAAKADNAGPPKSPLNTSKVSPVNTNSVTQGPSGSAIMTREPMQAPVMSSLETPSPPIVSPGQMAEAAETSKTEFDAAKDDQAAPVVVSERRKQWYREQAQAEKERLEQEESEITWDAHQNRYYGGEPDDNEEPERTPADAAERPVSVPPNEAEDINGDDGEDMLTLFETGYTKEDDDETSYLYTCAA